jgi:hypothetical protein
MVNIVRRVAKKERKSLEVTSQELIGAMKAAAPGGILAGVTIGR